MNHQDILSRINGILDTMSFAESAGGAETDLEALRDDLLKDLSNGITTARGRSLTHDHSLWHRPPHGTPFLLDWGTREAMEAKLAEMVIEPPVTTEPTQAITTPEQTLLEHHNL